AEAGYNFQDYDLECVRFTPVPTFNFGGLASVGARRCWLQGDGVGLLAHEFGHNLGLGHADFWDTRGPGNDSGPVPPPPPLPVDPASYVGHDSIICAGLDTEYGDPFDTMGSGGETSGNRASGQYNSYHKWLLNWLPEGSVKTVTENGTYRLFAYDAPSLVDGQLHALRVRKDSERNY